MKNNILNYFSEIRNCYNIIKTIKYIYSNTCLVEANSLSDVKNSMQ